MLFAAAATTTSKSGSFTPILIVAVIGVLVYLLLMRPQRNRQRRQQQMQSDISPGQRVRTTAGIYGTVVTMDGQDAELEIAPGVEIRILRRAIMEVVPEDGPGEDYAEGEGPDGSHEDIPAEEAAAHEEAHAQAEADEAADSDGDGEAAEGEHRDRDPQDHTP
jgi:preprotein translocase subunit YajC